MRVVIQRVKEASVAVDRQICGKIESGLLILAGFETDDSPADLDWMAGKIVRLRLFADENGVMNRSVVEAGGEILAVSQFTLMYRSRCSINLLPSWRLNWASPWQPAYLVPIWR